ncbi:MAG: UDP-N-acetylmuramate dehydrogenase [Alphaproteobacteria bacterium]
MSDYQKIFDSLTELKGRYELNAPLARYTWLRVGGNADAFFRPKDEADLQYFLQNCPNDIPITILGLGSNVLIRDGGIRGIVIRLRGQFSYIEHHNDMIVAGAGTPDLRIAKYAAQLGLDGFAFLSGIPGNLGGALKMNAGAFGREIQDLFISARAIDRNGWVHEISFEHMGFSYRHTQIPNDWIFLSATMKASGRNSREDILAKIQKIQDTRDADQPKGARTAGSTFANPEGHKVWQLIDKVGMRGYKLGGAQVSEKHCNFLLNTGDATAKDIEDLGELIRQKVKNEFNIELRWEIRRIGEHS